MHSNKQGLILAITAYSVWGCYPLYFTHLNDVSPVEVLSHRILWSLLVTSLIGLILGRWHLFISALQDRKLMGWLALSSFIISSSWLVYIWAVGQNRVIEASLGYFISPVVSLLLAKLFFNDKLHPLQWWAGIIATLAIVWEFISFGQLPWVSLALAITFALYGVIRKHYPVDSIIGMTMETLWLMPFAIAWLVWQPFEGQYALLFGTEQTISLLLIGTGIVSALPLVLFAMATNRIDLSVVGFIMYINPTMQFLIGVFLLDEVYPPQRMITFILVWIALALFLFGFWKLQKNDTIYSANE